MLTQLQLYLQHQLFPCYFTIQGVSSDGTVTDIDSFQANAIGSSAAIDDYYFTNTNAFR